MHTLNDIILIIDKNGIQVVSYTYDIWRILISLDGTLKVSIGDKNPYRYIGYRYDTETGLYYLQSRYYNPDWGRFINVDAIIGQTGELLGHNMFAYCKNNPISLKDEHGFLSTGVFDECGGWEKTVEYTYNAAKAYQYYDLGQQVVETYNTKSKYDVPKLFGKNKGKLRIKNPGSSNTYVNRGVMGIAGQAIKRISKKQIVLTAFTSTADNYVENNGKIDGRFLAGTAIDFTTSLLIMATSTAIVMGFVAGLSLSVPGIVVGAAAIGLAYAGDWVVNDVIDVKRRILN